MNNRLPLPVSWALDTLLVVCAACALAVGVAFVLAADACTRRNQPDSSV